MRAKDIARDRQPQPGAPRLAITAGFHAEKRIEHTLELIGRQPRPIVLDGHRQHARDRRAKAHTRGAAIFHRIADQIGKGALEHHRPSLDRQVRRARVIQRLGRLGPGVRRLVEHGAQQRRQVERHRRFGVGRIAPEGQGRRNHAIQLGEIGQELGAQFIIVDEFGAQAQAGDWRAQIVPHRGQQEGAVGDETRNAPRHGVERNRRPRDLGRTILRQRRRIDVTAKPLGRLGQRAHGPGQPAHRPEAEPGRGDRHQHEGEQKMRRVPGPRRRHGNGHVQPAPLLEVVADDQLAVPGHAAHDHFGRPVSGAQRNQVHVDADDAAQRLRGQRCCRSGWRIGQAGLHALVMGEFAQGCGPLGRRGRHHGAVDRHRAEADVAQLGLVLELDAIERVDRQAGALHQGQAHEQGQQGAGG